MLPQERLERRRTEGRLWKPEDARSIRVRFVPDDEIEVIHQRQTFQQKERPALVRERASEYPTNDLTRPAR